MANVVTSASSKSELKLVVEKLRLAGYSSFWVLVIVGIFLTCTFTHLDMEDTLLVQLFGYNNICVYFDYPPSNYVLPFLWAITLTIMLAYVVTHWLQMRSELQTGLLTNKTYKLLTGLKAFEAFTLISFSTVFAVNPTNDPIYTVYIHTIPFFLLQIGMVSLAMSNTIHGIKSTYWQRLDLPEWFSRAAIGYCVLFALIVAFKIPTATTAMIEYPNWDPAPSLITMALIVDKLFLIFAAVIPMAKAGYLLYSRPDKVDTVILTPQ